MASPQSLSHAFNCFLIPFECFMQMCSTPETFMHIRKPVSFPGMLDLIKGSLICLVTQTRNLGIILKIYPSLVFFKIAALECIHSFIFVSFILFCFA